MSQTQDWQHWSQAKLQRIVDSYIQRHPEASGQPVDKLVIAALEDALPDVSPVEILAAVELRREVERITRNLRKAGLLEDPYPTFPGLEVPVLYEGRKDERGVATVIRGREAYLEELAQHWEQVALEDERTAKQSTKRAKTARWTVSKLASYGLDTTTTAYEDVPDELVTRLRSDMGKR